MRQCLKEGGDVDGGALHCAASNAKYNAVDFLMQHGANPNFKNSSLSEPLRFAVRRGDERMASLLLAYGATVSNDTGMHTRGSLLHIAASDRGSGRLVSLLLKHGANPNVQTRHSLTSPLMRVKEEYTAELLLAAGADVNAADAANCTALHWAVHFGAPKIVTMLLARGADPNKVSNGGTIARHLATTGAYPEHQVTLGILDAHQRRALTRRLVDVCATLTLVGAPVLVLLECFSWVATEMLGPVELPRALQWRIAARVHGALVRKLAAQQAVDY